MLAPRSTVVELRNYRLRPGRRDELIELFEREFVEAQEAEGISLVGLFRDADHPDAFVWVRAFAGMDERKRALEAFYGGPVWRSHREAANATMVDSDNVLMLRPHDPTHGFPESAFRGPLFCATKLFSSERELLDFAPRFAASIRQQVELHGGHVIGAFLTEASENTFPQLPVREGEFAFVFLTSGVSRDALAANDEDLEVMELVPTARSRMRLAFSGRPGDFDFLTRIHTVTHRKLRERLRSCNEWDSASGSYRGYSLANGAVSVDEMDLPAPGVRGCSIRNLDVAAARWSIHWTTSSSGKLFPPVHGGFYGDRGEFFGNDVEVGVPVVARYVWSNCWTDRPRWEQAFSTDGGRTWEPNWIMEFRP